ncbi:hypothetical protein FHS27_004659 [Rhodopirellula rubra]|uniref:Uncharacterized protein n=1 Tax=Aporhodopirellula rubra TaxID=980271 RepID=A0A7W5E256_9BACT|nr:hypothetical protein [Aporhodopirellula rubra]
MIPPMPTVISTASPHRKTPAHSVAHNLLFKHSLTASLFSPIVYRVTLYVNDGNLLVIQIQPEPSEPKSNTTTDLYIASASDQQTTKTRKYLPCSGRP